MFFSQDRNEIRKVYCDSLYKLNNNLSMNSNEIQVAEVISMHPEYHNIINLDNLDRDYKPEDNSENPFLHMGLHIAVIDQLKTNRPNGIVPIYKSLLKTNKSDDHKTQHIIMDKLAETIWDAQKNNTNLDEQIYLNKLHKLLNK